MGRGKIEIKKIENVSSRQVTFSKRKTGLMKKARELSILCDAETAVIIFSNTGKLYEFASSSMNQVLSRYNKCLEASETSMTEHEAEETNPSDVGVLEKEIAQLKQNQMRLLGKDLKGMGLNELQELEQLLNDGLFAVKDRKEQLLMHQLEQSRLKEEHVMLENMSLHKQIEELQSYFPVGAQPVSSSLEYAQEKRNFPETNGASSPNTISRSGAENVDMMTTLQLRTPALAQPERKVPEQVTAGKGSRSGTSSH